MEEEYIDLNEVLNVLKRGWLLILITTIISTMIALLYTIFMIKPMYATEAKIFIGKEDIVNSEYSNNDVQMYHKLMNTYKEIMVLYDLIDSAIEESGHELKTTYVMDQLTVVPQNYTQIINVSLELENSIMSKEILDVIISNFIRKSEKLIPNGSISVLERTRISNTPVSPNIKLNTTIGFMLGIMISCFYLFIVELIKTTIKSEEQLEKIVAIPVLAVLPTTKNLEWGSN